jgi:hypothetical protein
MPGLSIGPGLSLGLGLTFTQGLATAGGLSPTSGSLTFLGYGTVSVATRQTMQVTVTLPGGGALFYGGSVAFRTNPATLQGASGLLYSGTLGLQALAGFTGSGGNG